MKRPHNTRHRILAFQGRKRFEPFRDSGIPDPQEMLGMLSNKPALYHCISRVVNKQKVLGSEEKEKFIEYMRVYEQFCQVRILTYCVMSNHFHILVEVPEPPEDRGRSWSDEKFLRHVSCLYSGPDYAEIKQTLHRLREQGAHAAAEEHRDQYFDRMWDLSQFMKTLKQRFVQWYNWKHDRSGSFWSERFKSILVESGHAARIVAAYIDLNPVRAGMVEDPADYRWSGYGEAVAGYRRAREGIWLLGLEEMAARWNNDRDAVEKASKWSEAHRHYRQLLYLEGEEDETDRRKGRAGIPPGEVARVLRTSGGLSEEEITLLRLKPFADGGALGSERFIKNVLSRIHEPARRPYRGGLRKLV